MKSAKALTFRSSLTALAVIGFCVASVQAQAPWTFKGASIILDRSHPDSLVLMQDTAAPGSNLDAAALDLGWHHGWDIGAIRQGDEYDLNFEVMNVNDWDGRASAITGPATLVQINTIVPIFVAGVTAVNATYESKMLSAEVNLRRRYSNDLTFLGGIRYLQLDERFHADVITAGATPTYDTDTSNDLIGAQIGVDATLTRRGPFSLDLVSKIGMYYNTALQNSTFYTGIGLRGLPGTTINAAGKDKGPAFLGEVELAGGWEVTDSIELRAGYMLMWVESVALAPEQVVVTDFVNGTGINSAGGAFYHGALFQVIVTR